MWADLRTCRQRHDDRMPLQLWDMYARLAQCEDESERVTLQKQAWSIRTRWLADLKAVGDGISQLKMLQQLNLDFDSCRALTDVKAVGDGISQLKSLQQLTLSFFGCAALTDVKAVEDGISQLKLLQELNLDFRLCRALTDVKAVGDGVSQLKSLRELNLKMPNCGSLWGLDSLDEAKLRKGLPNLQTCNVHTTGSMQATFALKFSCWSGKFLSRL